MADQAKIDAAAFNAFEAAGWNSKAATYDDFFGRITARLVEPLLDAAGVGPESRVLDVATGPGYAAGRAAGRGASVVGIDVAEAMVALARRLHPQVDFRSGNAEALPFADGSFDAVVGNFVLLHLGDPERAASELARVLVPGGRIALTVWDMPERMRVLGVVLDAVGAAGAPAPPELPVGPPFFRFADDDEFTSLLLQHGLVEAQVRSISFVHPVESAGELWEGLMASTVRTSALILAQPEPVQQRIRAALDRAVEPYAVDGRLELPVSVKLASARKP
jgi:SAM-dependent methyltransferase